MPYCFVRVPWKLFREHGPVTKLPAIEVGNAVSAGSVVPTSVRSNDAGFEGSGATTWKPTPPAVPVRDEVAEQLGVRVRLPVMGNCPCEFGEEDWASIRVRFPVLTAFVARLVTFTEPV